MSNKKLKKLLITALTALALTSGSALVQANDIQRPAPRVWGGMLFDKEYTRHKVDLFRPFIVN